MPLTETVEVSSAVTKQATCTQKGETAYTSAAFTKEGFEAQSVTVADIDAIGHRYGAPVWSWSADHRAATAVFACEHGDDTQTVTGSATEVEVSAATATDDRVVKYTASVVFGGKTYTTESENIVIPGTATGGHGGPCRWCGKNHTGSFWQRLVGFFHSILYFFAHLFGLR